ncbi:MAG TPA: hypothetical protein VGL65_11435 [Gemmatimonadales bacterium]|jgi:hypothetical protein
MTEPFGTKPPHDAQLRREGIITGVLGAVVVALFYFVVDLTRGHALMTPSVLGEAFILHQPVLVNTPDAAAIVAYTVFHFVAFIAFGLLLAALTRASETSSLARYAVVQLLVVFLLFFYGVLSVGSELVRGMFPFIGVLAANALAGAVMVGWLWRHHPALRMAAMRTPLGANNDA